MAKGKSRFYYVKKADQAFSLYIRKRTELEYGCCPFCGGPIEHCFHWISRRHYSIRWLPCNAIGSCSSCNFTMQFDPNKFYLWFIKKWGTKRLEKLTAYSNRVRKYSNNELLGISQKFESRFNKLSKMITN